MVDFCTGDIARVIARREDFGTDRAAFFVPIGRFDTHNTLDRLPVLLSEIDNALGAFAEEMRARDLFEDVAVATTSDFGRTLTWNGLGTDHAWGGNYFMAGGAVNGSQLFGSFPSSFIETSDVVISRNGRIIPTTPWESVWVGLSEWFGVESTSMAEVLPNFANFPAETIFHATATDGLPGLTVSAAE